MDPLSNCFLLHFIVTDWSVESWQYLLLITICNKPMLDIFATLLSSSLLLLSLLLLLLLLLLFAS